jgi:hypothetical protein
VIGVLTAPAAPEDGKASIQKIDILGACARGIESRVLQEPDELGRSMVSDILDALLHIANRLFVRHGLAADFPFNGNLFSH